MLTNVFTLTLSVTIQVAIITVTKGWHSASAGEITKRANDAVKAEYDKVLKVFGWKTF